MSDREINIMCMILLPPAVMIVLVMLALNIIRVS